jgi:hypothetical protein
MSSGRFPIAVKNLSSVVSDAQVRHALPAFQKQVSRDFLPHWGVAGQLTFYPKDAEAPPEAWLLALFDTSDDASAMGYHETTRTGKPTGKVFAKTSARNGSVWTVTFSHELLEMLLDPECNLQASDDEANRVYAYEVCDAVEADADGYEIDGVLVSDFVLPAWFEPGAPSSERFAFHSEVHGPCHLRLGGYISCREWGRSSSGQAHRARGRRRAQDDLAQRGRRSAAPPRRRLAARAPAHAAQSVAEEQRGVTLDEVFLRISVVDGKKRCHCGGPLTVTHQRHGELQVHWASCQSCRDSGALQIEGTDRASYGLWKKPEAGE